MMIPKIICSPPKPAASSQFPHPAGANNPAAPRTIKQIPITGTTLTENMPPVTTPVPYNSNHIPGIAFVIPARKRTTVSKAPTTIGGERLKATLRPGPVSSGVAVARAFRSIDQPEMSSAISASANHVSSQAFGVDCCAAR